MNNEPVAWMSEFGQFIGKVQDEICHIPLYTHPANACKHGVDDGACKECYLESSNPYKAITNTKIEPTAVSYTHPVKEQDGCGNCHACLVGVTENGYPVTMQRMILCPDCGNKRCPKASNHRYQCTNSNEPNQRGSIYTHPVKELTDEEIFSIAIDCTYGGDLHADKFARAILIKAQEK